MNFHSQNFVDAMLAAPGTGRHIERILMFLSRLQLSLLNLMQMKAISNYMLNMVNAVEEQNRITKYEHRKYSSILII